MANYNIYIGVPASDRHYIGTLRNVTEDEALKYAKNEAYKEYDNGDVPSYDEEIESWAIYEVKEESSDKDFYKIYDEDCKGYLN